jgi:hypothetical protein
MRWSPAPRSTLPQRIRSCRSRTPPGSRASRDSKRDWPQAVARAGVVDRPGLPRVEIPRSAVPPDAVPARDRHVVLPDPARDRAPLAAGRLGLDGVLPAAGAARRLRSGTPRRGQRRHAGGHAAGAALHPQRAALRGRDGDPGGVARGPDAARAREGRRALPCSSGCSPPPRSWRSRCWPASPWSRGASWCSPCRASRRGGPSARARTARRFTSRASAPAGAPGREDAGHELPEQAPICQHPPGPAWNADALTGSASSGRGSSRPSWTRISWPPPWPGGT